MSYFLNKKKILGYILEKDKKNPKTNDPAKLDGFDSWHTIGNDKFDIDVKQFLRVMSELDRSNLVKIIMYWNDPFETDNCEGLVYTEDGWLVLDKENLDIDYIILDKSKIVNLLNKTDEILEDDEFEGIEPIKKVYDFTIYNNNMIGYKYDYLQLQPQKEKILISLLNNVNTYLDFSLLKSDSGISQDLPRSTIGKYISDINNVLRKKTKILIKNMPDKGWGIFYEAE